MKTRKNLLFLLLTVSMFAVVGCSTRNDVSESVSINAEKSMKARKTPISTSSMPYTSHSELYSLYAADPQHVIHYNVARLLASTELVAGANNALNVNPDTAWYLTQFPKVIYNYDNTPKYYEFGYVVGRQIVATVTTYAQREVDGVIAYLFPEPLSYPSMTLDYYVGNYPNRYMGSGGVCYLNSSEGYLSNTDFSMYGSTGEEDLHNMLSMMKTEDINAINSDMLEEGSTNYNEDKEEIINYWDEVDKFLESHSELLSEKEPDPKDDLEAYLRRHPYQEEYDTKDNGTDQDIVGALLKVFDYLVGNFVTHELAEYSNPNLHNTRWQGFCGPSVCAWIYRGKYNSYKGHYLPLHGYQGPSAPQYFVSLSDHAYYQYNDISAPSNIGSHTALYYYTTRSNDADYGLCSCFYNEAVPFIYRQEWQFPLYHGGLNRGFDVATDGKYQVQFTCSPYEYMINNQEPIIIAINCDHYIAAFASMATLKKNNKVKDVYFVITDNGTVIGSNGYRPMFRRKNGWNLHYGMKRN